MTKITKDQVVEWLSEQSVLEISSLVKELEEKWGVSAAAPVAVAAVSSGDAGGSAKAEQTEFNVILTSIGDKKINVIKEVRAITGLTLKDAKDIVEGAPKAIKEGVSKEEAEEIAKKIEEAGAKVELK